MEKRFIVSLYEKYYPSGGGNDIKKILKTLTEAKSFLITILSFYEQSEIFADIYDIENEEIVLTFSRTLQNGNIYYDEFLKLPTEENGT